MTSRQHARELALALPETIEQDHHGRPSFRVADKIFATRWDEDHMNLMLDEPGIRTATQQMPEICSEVWWDKRLRAVRVELAQISAEELGEMLTDAWEHKAPSRLVARGGQT
jgi:hypothetical protein